MNVTTLQQYWFTVVYLPPVFDQTLVEDTSSAEAIAAWLLM